MEKSNINISEIFSAKESETIRIHDEMEHEIRGKFDRDRDRILYSKSFRRLSGKTQVFLSGKDDHIRNRMTHTLEVSQIARTISKALGLNEALTEAIALGHDLGHTPFGHVGERTLNYIMCGCDQMRDFSCLSEGRGFKHNWQGIRVVTELENVNTYEGLKVALADEIAQRHHDVEDALETKIMDFEELYSKIDEVYVQNTEVDKMKFLELKQIEDKEVKITKLSSFLVNLLTFNAIDNIQEFLENIAKKYNIINSSDFEVLKSKKEFINELIDNIYLDEKLKDKDSNFQRFIRNRILNSYKAQSMDGKGSFIVRELFKAYIANPQQLPDKTIRTLFLSLEKRNIVTDLKEDNIGDFRDKLNKLHSKSNVEYERVLMRTICDYISGMTDRYAMQLYSDLYETNQF